MVSFRVQLAQAQHQLARRCSISKIQAVVRGSVQRSREKKVRHIRSVLGGRVNTCISNLRRRVEHAHARCLTAFVLAIPASTKVFVALRMFRKNVIRVQRWWRSFLACKLIRIRCLVRIWSLVEDSYKLEIENAVRKSERHKVRNSGSLDTLANFGSAYGASGEYGGDNQEELNQSMKVS